MIICGIFVSSVFYVDWKALDNEHYQEVYEIITEIGQKEMKINTEFGKYGQLLYFQWVNVQNAEKFPILKEDKSQSKMTFTITDDWEVVYDFDGLRDYFQFLEKQKITHLILDKYANAKFQHELNLHLLDMFNHENKYTFLIKEYDSRENGFNYHLKLFKIDYDLYNEWINKN